MADNTVLNTGTGGDTIASDDIGGIKHQRVKIEYGADGSATDVSATTPLPVINSTITSTGTITATNGTVELATEGANGCAVILTGTWSATVVFEASIDGTNWIQVETYNPATSSELIQSSTTANGSFVFIDGGGIKKFRARASVFTSGTIQVDFTGNAGMSHAEPFSREDGTANPSYGVQIGGTDGSNFHFGGCLNTGPGGTEYGLLVRPIGQSAHDAAVSGNPLRIAGKANQNEPAAVSADGDTVDIWADLQGRQVMVKNFPSQVASTTHGPNTSTLTTTSDAALVGAPGAGLSVYVSSVSASNTSSTKSRIDLKDGTTVRYSMMLAADGGGFVQTFDPPWKITANTAFNGALGTAVTDVRVNTHYFIAP